MGQHAGLSRAVVDGRNVYVSGTLPVDADGALKGGDNACLQARQVLLLQQAQAEAGTPQLGHRAPTGMAGRPPHRP